MDDEARLWMDQAASDLDTARFNAEGGRFAAAAFFAQQAAEKAPKAAHIARHGALWRVHDLVALAAAVGAPADVVARCERLAPHYIATRSPVGPMKAYDADVARRAVADAEEVVAWVAGTP